MAKEQAQAFAVRGACGSEMPPPFSRHDSTTRQPQNTHDQQRRHQSNYADRAPGCALGLPWERFAGDFNLSQAAVVVADERRPAPMVAHGGRLDSPPNRVRPARFGNPGESVESAAGHLARSLIDNPLVNSFGAVPNSGGDVPPKRVIVYPGLDIPARLRVRRRLDDFGGPDEATTGVRGPHARVSNPPSGARCGRLARRDETPLQALQNGVVPGRETHGLRYPHSTVEEAGYVRSERGARREECLRRCGLRLRLRDREAARREFPRSTRRPGRVDVPAVEESRREVCVQTPPIAPVQPQLVMNNVRAIADPALIDAELRTFGMIRLACNFPAKCVQLTRGRHVAILDSPSQRRAFDRGERLGLLPGAIEPCRQAFKGIIGRLGASRHRRGTQHHEQRDQGGDRGRIPCHDLEDYTRGGGGSVKFIPPNLCARFVRVCGPAKWCIRLVGAESYGVGPAF